MREEAAVESPCIRECRVDQATGYCVSCFRTLREISYWETCTPDEQRRIMAQIEERRAAQGARPA
jgi:uncharacterized protein